MDPTGRIREIADAPPVPHPDPAPAARILSLCLLVPTLLYARPGGGGSFHSGGSGGHSLGAGHGFSAGVHGHAGISQGGPLGLGDSAVSGRQILFFIGLLAAYLLFRLLAGWVFRAGARALGARAGADPDRQGPQPPPGVQPVPGLQGLQSLRRQDPGLTEEGITRRALQMAEILREAWCAGDMRPARSFVSDGVFCRFTTQLAMMRARGERNVMGDARIVAIASAGAELAPPLEDRASFLFWKWIEACAQGSAAPVRKCATAGFLTAMPAAPALLDVAVGGVDLLACGPAGEHGRMDAVTVRVTWSGASGPGAESLPRVQLIAMARQAGVMSSPASSALLCPECGAALGASDSDQCDHCYAQVATGAHAWVLAGVVAG